MKRWIAIGTALCLMWQSAGASILGSEQLKGETTQLGWDTYFTENVFYSDQSGVGEQAEYIISYQPGGAVKPLLYNGTQIYGSRTLSQAVSQLTEQNIRPIMGMNADYFSLQTGVPMGHTIINGEVITKDSEGQDAIGFLEDGSAFIDWLQISTTLTVTEDADAGQIITLPEEEPIIEAAAEGETAEESVAEEAEPQESPEPLTMVQPDIAGLSITIDNINKYRQPYGIYMMTDDFGADTKVSAAGIDVILSPIEGSLSIGGELTAVVDEITEYDGAIAIPKGKIVLSLDKKGYGDLYAKLLQLGVGDRVTISTTANDPKWADVVYGTGTVGGRLIAKGEVKSLSGSAAPRTAVGVKEDGTVIFYAIDGRQKGHSYGVKLTTLAQRMKELGCVDAINLDGGGSTTIGGVTPIETAFTVWNSPSDGAQRRVANFLFLQNTAQPTGVPSLLLFKVPEKNLLAGTRFWPSVTAVDTAFYPTELPGTVTYSLENGETTEDGGALIAYGNGSFTVTAQSGDIQGTVSYRSVESPSEIRIAREDGWESLSALRMDSGEQLDLKAQSYLGRVALLSEDSAYEWSLSDPALGSIDGNGVFTAAEANGISGTLQVKAGSTVKEIPISVGSFAMDYPVITITETANGFTAQITDELNTHVAKDQIFVYLDGYAVDFTYDEENRTVQYEWEDPTQKAQKVKIIATNTTGGSGMGFLKTAGSSEGENPFTDTEENWARDYITYLYEHRIVNGIINDDGSLAYQPGKAMTRAEFAVMLSNFLQIEPDDYRDGDLPYDDLDSLPAWALPQIRALYEKGIMKGQQNGDLLEFRPTSSVTRAEAITMISRILPAELAQQTLSFSDAQDVPEWAEEAFCRLLSAGIISGYDDNTLRPKNEVTKAEAAKICYMIY